MRNKLRRFEVLLPTQYNDGRDVPDESIADAIDEIIAQFGTVSFHKEAVEGYWQHAGTLYRDELGLIVVDIPNNAKSRKWMKAFKARWKERLEQLEIWMVSYLIDIEKSALFGDWRLHVDWFDPTNKYHVKTFPKDARLSSLPKEWQRELAAIWRLEADVNNGAYLQFLRNWGRETYVYASQALKKIGADKMALIVDSCQALVDEHLTNQDRDFDEMRDILPEAVVARIYELSYEFMAYPDDFASLGTRCYGHLVRADSDTNP